MIAVTIEGITPLLMHRWPLEPIPGIDKQSKEEQARTALYEHDGNTFVPGVNIQRALVSGAGYSKGKGRSSLAKIAAACLSVREIELPLNSPWVVDARAVTIPATGGRITRYRPRFDAWKLEFNLEYDPTLLSAAEVRRIVDDTGSRVGLLDFRPECKGPFGRFMITSWVSSPIA